jgi:hypothetical protein
MITKKLRNRITETKPKPLPASNDLAWFSPDASPFKLIGFNWFEQEHLYRRLPLINREPFPAGVEASAWNTAGGQIKFSSNTAKITLKVELREAHLMDHMPQTGSSGFDLYCGEPQQEKFCGVTRFKCGDGNYCHEIFNCNDGKMRNFTLNFPLYCGVKEVQIGLTATAKVLPPPPFVSTAPIVAYGTSITQGGCASRPGSCYTNILSRHLNAPFINLGFSGAGRGEPVMAELLASLTKPRLIILDYEANAKETLPDTLPHFITVIRRQHQFVPILLISAINFSFTDFDCDDTFINGNQQIFRHNRKFQKQLVNRRCADGDKQLYFLDGKTLLGSDHDECTVDGIHPTDSGFYRIANKIEAKINSILC